MFELIFVDRTTGQVNWAVRTRNIRYITLSEVGYYTSDGRPTSTSFTHTENLEVNRVEE